MNQNCGGEGPDYRGHTLALVDHIRFAFAQRVPPDPTILYVYMPADAARSCLQQGSLDAVPRGLLSGGGRVVAFEIPPYDTNVSRGTVALQYRMLGCNYNAADIDFFVAIPLSSRWCAAGKVRTAVYMDQFATRYRREAQGDRDVVVSIGPALFRD
ncbi:RolB family protein [Rhizobium leguminosarum]|uniref:RolB family protein n=1 Tax=Rhizobium leguminosarum TaxID=384 RepID=UPI00391A5BD7